MKFYIFGNNASNMIIRTKSKKALYKSSSLDDTLEQFKIFVDQVRHNNLYMIADFENRKASLFKTSSLDDDLDNKMPFFVIAEWHVGNNKNKIIRCDHTFIEKKGFLHEFQNNLTAIQDYLYSVENEDKCSFGIIYSKFEKVGRRTVEKQFKREISSSEDRRVKGTRPIKKLKISSSSWNFVPINRNNLSMFTIPRIEESTESKAILFAPLLMNE